MKKLLSFMILILCCSFSFTQDKETPASDNQETTEMATEKSEEEQNYSEQINSADAYQISKKIYKTEKKDFLPKEAKLSLTSKDDLSQLKNIQYSIDRGNYKKYTTPLTITKDGDHIIIFKAYDNAGNLSKELSFSFYMDSTPPEVFLVPTVSPYFQGNNIYISPLTEGEFKAIDTGSGVQGIYFSLDDGGYSEYLGEKLAVKDSGMHKIKYFSADNVGNKSAEMGLSFYLDKNAPIVEITTDDFIYFKGDQVIVTPKVKAEFKATDDGAGVQSILFSIDGGKYVSYTEPFNVEEEGEHTIEYYAVDNVLNTSTVEKLSFIVDATPPDSMLNIGVEGSDTEINVGETDKF